MLVHCLPGDFGTPRNLKCQAVHAQEYRTLVSRMFISLGLADDIVDAIVDEQGYDTPHALSHLDERGVEQLVTAIRKPEEPGNLESMFPFGRKR